MAGRQQLLARLAATVLPVLFSLSATAHAADAGSRIDFRNLKSWGYQLQNLDVEQASRMPHELLVVDYSKDGSEAGALTRSELARLKRRPDGTRRIVLAYLSIGEAEDYRYYWQPHWKLIVPDWLGRENKQWRGNYLVKYWMPDWQKIILEHKFGYLDKIIGAGFDGVYLDRVDAYAEWAAVEKDARKDMIEFVIRLSKTAKSKSKDFLVFVQNAEELLMDTTYISHLDGIAKEDMLFGAADRTKPNSKSLQASHIKYLKIARRHNKPVLVVEYLPEDPAVQKKTVLKIRDLKFIPYTSKRALDELFLPPK